MGQLYNNELERNTAPCSAHWWTPVGRVKRVVLDQEHDNVEQQNGRHFTGTMLQKVSQLVTQPMTQYGQCFVACELL